MRDTIIKLVNKSQNRYMLSSQLIKAFQVKAIAEVGVFRGKLAKYLLENNHSILTYTMIDPWKKLPDWNKPANKDDKIFEEYYKETLRNTDFAKEKRRILRGKTHEVKDQIENDFLDFAYIDGDHTLRGISIDLINMWPKVKKSGFIMGDDFTPSIWQHNLKYEPTMVFPFAIYFAEAMNVKVYGLPFNQFLIVKQQTGFQFIDLTNGKYSNRNLRSQFINLDNFRMK